MLNVVYAASLAIYKTLSSSASGVVLCTEGHETLTNIFRNFIPHEVKIFDSKHPPWFTKEIKKVLQRKNRLYKKYMFKGMGETDGIALHDCTTHCYDLISTAKETYLRNLGTRLNDPSTQPKKYWSIVNKLMGKIKIPTIPPILYEDNLETNFERKANIFNDFFSTQCTMHNNASLPNFYYCTDERLPSIEFSSDDIYKIIKELNPNKAHGYDDISVRMIKLCGKAITIPLSFIFSTSIRTGIFPQSWKNANVVPIHKKSSKQKV